MDSNKRAVDWSLENDRATIGRQQSGTIGQSDDQIAIGRPLGEVRSGAIWTSIQSGNRAISTTGPISRQRRLASIGQRMRSGAFGQLAKSGPIEQ